MYPEIICFTLNAFLSEKGMNIIETDDVLEDIIEPRYIKDGILKVCDIYTGQRNKGIRTSPLHPGVKGRMCELFDITDNNIKNLLDKAKKDYPNVETFVKNIFNFE